MNEEEVMEEKSNKITFYGDLYYEMEPSILLLWFWLESNDDDDDEGDGDEGDEGRNEGKRWKKSKQKDRWAIIQC